MTESDRPSPASGGMPAAERAAAVSRVVGAMAGLGSAERAAMARRLLERVVRGRGPLAACELLVAGLSDEEVRALDASRPRRPS